VASKNPEVSRAVLNVANACKHPADKEGIAAARAALATAKVADCIERTSPPHRSRRPNAADWSAS